MTAVSPDIDFRQIRVHGSPASRAGGYEELSSLLIMDGIRGKVDWPAQTRFDRFGNPDGGREGRGVLANGDVWAWQSKYLFEFTDKDAAQVEKSVKRALDTEHTLKRYLVALPYDLPAGDTKTAKGAPVVSAFTRWEKKKSEWEALASAKGMDVEFVFVGQSDLTDALTSRVENAGRARYWFGASVLSTKEQQDRLTDVIAAAGRRYTPKLHVHVEAAKALEGLGRRAGWLHEIQVALAGVRRARTANWRAPEGDPALADLLAAAVASLDSADLALVTLIEAAGTTGPLPEPEHEVTAARSALDAAARGLRSHADSQGIYRGQAATTVHTIRKAQEAAKDAALMLRSGATAAARRGVLLMTGRAGVGKTHLFCDIASRRIDAEQPTVVLLGQDFDASTLTPQIGKLAQIEGTLDEVLRVLDAAGEAAGCAALLMVDAINEGAASNRWTHDLPRLVVAVDRCPNVVLAVSCRTEFVEPVVGTLDPDIPQVEHHGFAEATATAVERYTREYGLEPFAFPVLNPEFSNPLFLKLACEALSTLGERHFALGRTGLGMVIEAFLDAVNLRLSEAGRCDYDPRDRLVQKVARQVAADGTGLYRREEVKAIAEAALPGRSWSQSLFAGLLREGVFMETRDDGIHFAYQRLGDILHASLLTESSEAEVTTWLTALKPTDMWRHAGVIGALAVLVPPTFNIELPDLLPDLLPDVPLDPPAEENSLLRHEVADAFLEGLALRSPDDTTERTAQITADLLGQEDWRGNTWSALLRVACVPGHATNARWTHASLLARPLAHRDATWSEWLAARPTGPDDPVEVLLGWAWPAHGDPPTLQEDVATLGCLMLGWMLTTTVRRVRDRSMKALVAVGERNPQGFADAVRQFRTCDDPYVIEGLAAAICAIALRADDAGTVLTVADAANELIADGMPPHLAARDYLRRTAAVANRHGWAGPTWTPPYGAQWPVDTLSSETIQQMTAAPDYAYSSIWTSLTGMLGDFGTYVLKPAVENFAVGDHDALREHGARFIFSRAVDFGWTPQRFADLEEGRRFLRSGRGTEQVERYGKKYQWVGLHELLARLADTYQLQDRWGSARAPFDYSRIEELLYRDIDPTVLVRPGTGTGTDVTRLGPAPWFAPVAARFPTEVATEYPSTMDGIPDPLDLIAHVDDQGLAWLALTRHCSWTQQLPPELQALGGPTLYVWMQIRSYLIPTADVAAVKAWAADSGGQDYDGRWMAEEGEVYTVLLGTHPDSPDWDEVSGEVGPARGADDGPPPTSTLQVPFGRYGGTGTGRDTTGDISGYVPSRALNDLLDLRHGKDFTWTDASGAAVVDPSAGDNGESVLLMRRNLADLLSGNGLTLMWTVLLSKERRGDDFGRGDPHRAVVSSSATYVLDHGVVELISNPATHRVAGDTTGTPIPWTLRTGG